MALVTLQRSPSPSNDPDEASAEGGEDGADGRAALRHKKSKSTLERLRKIFSTVRFISKLRPCLSESYFTVKGAALILPHSDLNRKTSRKNHGGEIQRHLQSMLYLLRPEDKIKLAIRLENQRDNEHRYMALVSTMGRQDTEESVILGLDCTTTAPTTTTPATPPSSPTTPGAAAAVPFEGRGVALATIGLVLPIWMGMKVRLNGDGGFSISLDEKSYLFKPVSVQAMWSAIQSLDKALHQAEYMKYLAEGLTHTWVEYYRSKVDTTSQSRLTAWNLMEDVEIFAPSSLNLTNENETEKIKLNISAKLKEVMMSVDLDEATSRSLRQQVEQALNMKLDEYRNYFDEELIRILGQMDAPSQILDFLYLGSEWNASNLEELQRLGIKYILNVTREIDNFFIGMFHYCNVRLYDQEDSELMKHWLKTYKFINKARKHGSKVLVHCKMGISRSASTVMAFLMKENRWPLDKAFNYVKERRSCVRPNKGFMEQLQTYEGILNASNKRDIFRSKSEQDVLDAGEGEGEEGEVVQQGAFLGDSLFRVMSGSDTITAEEEILLRKGYGEEHDYTGMAPDFETDSRSADSMEESLPDMPSPLIDQPPAFTLPLQEPAIKVTAEENGSPCRQGQALTVGDLGGPSRIKPDSSWIKLESPGESTTDPPPAEAMEVGDAEEGAGRGEGQEPELIGPEPEPAAVVFVMGSEAEGEELQLPRTPAQSRVAEISSDTISETVEQQGGEFDMGVHQYYSREQIPWNPGKVRNLREEFCGAGQNGVVTVCDSSARSGATKPVPPQEEETLPELERTLLSTVSNIKEMPKPVSQCDSCVELSNADQGRPAEEEGMDVDDRSQSVYEREDIPLIPGTVQRTRQEIEERQKLYGDDCDQSIYGMKSIKRSSSLREERERDSSKNRDSERRKTCTPIVSPPPEKVVEMEGAEEVLDVGAAVLKLDSEVGESSTDDVEMAVKEGEKDEEGEKDVALYTFGEERVPVKVGIVRRHKQEIESKSGEGCGSHQRSLSTESNGSVSSGEEAEMTGHWSPHRLTPRSSSPGENLILTHTSDITSVHVHNIPAPKQPWLSLAQPSPAASASSLLEGAIAKPPEARNGAEGGYRACVFGAGKGRDSEDGWQQRVMEVGAVRGAALDSVAACSKMAGSVLHFSPRSRYSSEGSPQEHSPAEVSAKSEAAFRPYSHSFPSARKQVGQSNFDPETLAMIREIGSAFVASPTRTEEEESNGGSTSLVKHLVKNIEKETKVPKQERKIVIIDSSSGQSKRQVKAESGSSLFTPSPEFTSTMARHLSDFPEPSASSHTQLSVGSAGQSLEDWRKVPRSSSEPCGGVSLHCPSPRSILGFGERGGSEQPPSVVKHLRGRFEPHSPHCDSSEGEQGLLGMSDWSAQAPASQSPPALCHHGNACGTPVCLREKQHPSALGHGAAETLTKSKSLEEQPSGDIPESLSPAGQLGTAGHAGFHPHPSTQPPRRPRSAEHVPYHYSPGLRQGLYTPRVRVPWDRDPGLGMEEDGGSDGVKVRRLHGKSHPLSRLQQRQGDVPYPPAIQRHSPFHSTM